MIVEIIIATVFAIGFLLGRFLFASSLKSPGHQHIWRITGTESFIEVRPGQDIGRRKTKVLEVCFCSDRRINVLDGTWDKEQLTIEL